MANSRRRYGFWRALGRLQMRDLASAEFLLGTLIGAAGAWYLYDNAARADRVAVASDYLFLTAALLGVVFAGFALVMSMMSDHYVRLLRDVRGGVVTFLSPFMISIGFQVGAILGSVFYRAGAEHFPPKLEPWVFAIISVLFTVSVLDVVALARSIMFHAAARADELEIRDLQDRNDRSADP